MLALKSKDDKYSETIWHLIHEVKNKFEDCLFNRYRTDVEFPPIK